LSMAAAIAAVSVKKAFPAVTALVMSILAVAGVLAYLDFWELSFLYLVFTGTLAAGFLIAIHQKNRAPSEKVRLESQTRTGWYFVLALLIFTGCLYLIAHTQVWQYAAEIRSASFSELVNLLAKSYVIPLTVMAIFVLSLALIMIFKRWQKDT